jgi:hypothetical protein
MRYLKPLIALSLTLNACDRPVVERAENIDQQSEDTHRQSGDTHNLADVSDHRLVWLDISL